MFRVITFTGTAFARAREHADLGFLSQADSFQVSPLPVPLQLCSGRAELTFAPRLGYP
jgi:hypothetical protein